ncbi:MAG: peptidoglycan DD-metalloendopeptidase family protein [Lentimicrobium sp.]|jgi:murein DD-endopeptidase MepM/ murein hydrolase activator NlpD|nr:peptidoglycan DD-metalloendopeptidase family protein [Lentimicrobium sp.]MDD2528158.1 M23 family metallopeptidase [Lentimicrobiaceae bacterium]MDD4598799.1 M23 family metallopeptidase [Lentimicrobiaceae bacterium]MDY0026337.1 M23 family metallopeptidase [Lentimicrobium sp.]HAH58441.1 peptidase M23 [Bacteroidales bacterium]
MPDISDHRIVVLVIVFLISFFITSGSIQAQGFVIDTSGFFNEVTSKTLLPDLEAGPDDFEYPHEFLTDEEDNYMPDDMIFIPNEVLYKNRWDTLYIRTGRNDFSNWNDTIHLLLNNPLEAAFHFPRKGKLLSPYGPRGSRFHAGMDIKLETGDTVVSAFDGKVRIARVMNGYGKMVVVRHNNGLETVYGHLSRILVNVNDEVSAGTPLGLGGRSGRATTSHLHFETRLLGEHFDPRRIIDFDNFALITDTLNVNKSFWKIAASKEVASSPGSKKYHVIKSGDTLSAISRKYKISVKELCRMNGIKPDKILKIGTRIRVS